MVQGIVQIPGFCEIAPRYIHIDGSYGMMYLDLPAVRGQERISPVLRYDAAHPFDPTFSDPNASNLDGITEIVSADPGTFADYVVIQNQGDTNSGQTIVKADGTTIPIPNQPGSAVETEDLINQFGLYMYFERLDEPSTQSDRISFALDVLARMQQPTKVLQPAVSPAASDALGFQRFDGFDVGDTLRVSVSKNSMALESELKRVSEVTVSISDANMETLGLTLIDDKLGIVNMAPSPTVPLDPNAPPPPGVSISGGHYVGDTLTAVIT
jgi:hypothetical protein